MKLPSPFSFFMTVFGNNFYPIFQSAVGFKQDEKMRIEIENEI